MIFDFSAQKWHVFGMHRRHMVTTSSVIQYRRWMIRSYPFAMLFTVARMARIVLALGDLGPRGGEAVPWICNGLAAFLPSIFLDWPVIVRRTASRAATTVG
jgi:hypothetical protein